jgi:Zn-dependent protease
VTQTRTRDHASGTGGGSDPGRANRDGRMTSLTVRITAGGYLLAAVAALVSGLSLAGTAPGRGSAAYLAAGVAVAILLVGSLVIHEAGHILAARRHGAPARDITVGFFGPAQHGGAEVQGPRAQWRVALAGPAASLALAVLAGGSAAGLAVLGIDRLPMLILGYTAVANAAIGVLSLLPGTGPDGGRIVRALTWARTGSPAKADLVTARAGQVTGAALVAAGLTLFAGPGYVAGLWLALIGVLAFATSRAQARRSLVATSLAGLRVSDIVPPPATAPESQPSWQNVAAFLDDQGLRAAPRPGEAPAGSPAAVFPLHDFDGRPGGLLTLSQLAAVPAGRQDDLRLRDIATRRAHLVTTTPDEPLTSLIGRMSGWPAVPAAVHTAGYALVLGPEGELAGVVTPADLGRAAQLGALRQRSAADDTAGSASRLWAR